MQPYLQSLNVTKFRNAISKFRMTSNRLEIEAGRWVRVNERVPVNERKCRLCNVMEDECHFVIECHIYNELRKKYIPIYSLIFFNVQGGACQFLIDNDKVDHYI